MKIGFVGLGKLGLPTAVSIAYKGHDVMGFDVDPKRMTRDPQSYQEKGPNGTGDFDDWLATSTIRFGELKDVVDHGDIVFLAVQTPHDEMYDGTHYLQDKRVDFDYSFLRLAVKNTLAVADKPVVLAIISTVLPGTLYREIMPIVHENPGLQVVYNPSFIAMGTVMRDFFNPEFILLGSDDVSSTEKLIEFYATITDAPVRSMSIPSAELTKVAYNTYISTKICFANLIMEICYSFDNADCDDVMDALKSATTRLIAPSYLTPGMGDGGGCHPRDNLAMSWLARELSLSYDLFESIMLCRERQARRLASMIKDEYIRTRLPVIILGVAFKPETNLVDGSPALLVANILKELDIEAMLVDDSVGTDMIEEVARNKRAVFLIGCRHERYANFVFAGGSVVIDPHRLVPWSGDYVVVQIGKGSL